MIGILGLGIQSTLFYTNYLHTRYYQEFGKYHTYPYLQYQIDFDELNQFLPNNFDILLPRLEKIIIKLKELPPKKWIIPNITLHETFDQLATKVPILHPLELAIDFCKKNNITQIVIFGTKYSMNSSYLTSTFERNKISVENITAKDSSFIDALRTKIYYSNHTEKDLNMYNKTIEKYQQKNHIVIACTELSIISSQADSSKMIDLALLQLDKAYQHHIKRKKQLKN